jgi:hypothetical protein
VNIWKLTSETTEGKVVTSVVVALNPKQANEIFKNSIAGLGPAPVVRVKQLGQAASNFRVAEVILTTVS